MGTNDCLRKGESTLTVPYTSTSFRIPSDVTYLLDVPSEFDPLSLPSLFRRAFQNLRTSREPLQDLYERTGQKFPPKEILIDPETRDLTFRFALSGYQESDVELFFDSDEMVLKVSSGKEPQDAKLKYVVREIKRSSFVSRFPVPSTYYAVDSAKARMKNGILEVTIPAVEEKKPKKIAIQTS